MSKKKPPPRQPDGIVPGDGKAPGDFREKWVREQWRREWAGTPEEVRQRHTHTYLEHHGYQMEVEGRWPCRCPACVATRKHCYLEYWQAKELEEQASQQWHQTSDQYETFKGSAKAKNQLKERLVAEIRHWIQLSAETSRLMWMAFGDRPPKLSRQQKAKIKEEVAREIEEAKARHRGKK